MLVERYLAPALAGTGLALVIATAGRILLGVAAGLPLAGFARVLVEHLRDSREDG